MLLFVVLGLLMAVPITYSRDELMSKQSTPLVTNHRLDHGLFTKLKTLHLLNKAVFNIRGTRAGKHKSTLVKTARQLLPKGQSGPNHHNLVPIPYVPFVRISTKATTNTIKVTLLNARSIVNKSSLLCEHIIDNDTDIMLITETWLREGDDPVITNLCPPNYRFVGVPRPSIKGKTGGGVGLVFRSSLHVQPVLVSATCYNSFEAMIVKVGEAHSSHIVLIYRPPPSKNNRLTTPAFLTDIEDFLGHISTLIPGQLCILGDLNLHLDIVDDHYAGCFKGIISSLGLHQLVHQPTHRGGHTLDVVITRLDEPNVKFVGVSNVDISDHFILSCTITTDITRSVNRSIIARSIRKVDCTAFARDIEAKLLLIQPDGHVETYLAEYQQAVTDIMDIHAPLRTIRLKGEEPKPWYTEHIHKERQKRRQLERQFHKSGLEIHKQIFREQSLAVVRLIDDAKTNYYLTRFQAASSKETFKLLNDVMGTSGDITLPPVSDPQQLADQFADFFEAKVSDIRRNLDAISIDNTQDVSDQIPSCSFADFLPQSEIDILRIINRSATKSCSLDHLPTMLLKN